MIFRMRHGRRFHTILKYVASISAAIIYVTFLFRQSLNAFEQKKDTTLNLAIGTELKFTPKLKRIIGTKQEHLLPHNNNNNNLSHAAITATTVITAAAATTLNPIYEYSEEIHSATEKELKARNAHLNDVCQRYDLQAHYPPNTWEFFISPGHNLVWCNVFKAASSTWLYYFNILAGYNLRFLQRTKQSPINLARRRFPRPTFFELIESLPNSVSFLFVRDPFERVLSAYRNKFETGKNLYFKPLGLKIIRHYRKKSQSKDSNNMTRGKKGAPTFPEFIKYVIDQYAANKTSNEHWAPVYSFCTPCSVNFTIIGKVDTFQRDAEYIIRQAGLESLLLGKVPKHKEEKIGNISPNMKTKALIEKYYSQLNRKTLDELLNIYRLDFELFNYDFNKYYKIVSNDMVNEMNTKNTTTTVNIQNTQKSTSLSSTISLK